MNNHEEAKAEYAIDCLLYDEPWKRWQVRPYALNSWFTLYEPPKFNPEYQYRREDQSG